MSRPTLVLACLAALAAAPALAVDTGSSPSQLMQSARTAIASGDWDRAIGHLTEVVASGAATADTFNLLGYANRKAGRLETAGDWYRRALAADPDHAGALEYQGELFLMLGDLAAARANLARLAATCAPCEEYDDLARAIAAAGS
jgi:Flp pilus assembly protein TadD